MKNIMKSFSLFITTLSLLFSTPLLTYAATVTDDATPTEDTMRIVKVKTIIYPVDSNKTTITTLEPIVYLKDVQARKNAAGKWQIAIYNRTPDDSAGDNQGYPGFGVDSATNTYFVDTTTGKVTHQGRAWHKVAFMTAGTSVNIGINAKVGTTVTEEQLATLENDGHTLFQWKMFVDELPADSDQTNIETKVSGSAISIPKSKLTTLEDAKAFLSFATDFDGNDATDQVQVTILDQNNVEITDISTLQEGEAYQIKYQLSRKQYANPIATFDYPVIATQPISIRSVITLKEDAPTIEIDETAKENGLSPEEKLAIFEQLTNVPVGATVDDFIFSNISVNDKNQYQVTVTYTHGENDIDTIIIPITLKERINTAPIIQAEDKTIVVGETFDPLSGISAFDAEDGTILLTADNIIENTVDLTQPGTYQVTYKVTDSKGISTTKTIFITVEKAPVTDKPVTPPSNIGNNSGSISGLIPTISFDSIPNSNNSTSNTTQTPNEPSHNNTNEPTGTNSNKTENTNSNNSTPNQIQKPTTTKPNNTSSNQTISIDTNFNPADGYFVYDDEMGKIKLDSSNIVSTNVNLKKPGTYYIRYKLSGKNGATRIETVTVEVKKATVKPSNNNSAQTINGIVRPMIESTAEVPNLNSFYNFSVTVPKTADSYSLYQLFIMMISSSIIVGSFRLIRFRYQK